MKSVAETMNMDPQYTEWMLKTEVLAGNASNYCDHAEHVEDNNRQWVIEAANGFREVAVEIAKHEGVELLDNYATRLGDLEEDKELRLFALPLLYDGRSNALQASTWRDIQLVQIKHDLVYNPKLTGKSRLDQLRIRAGHLSINAGNLILAAQLKTNKNQIRKSILPDILITSLAISTILHEKLPDTPIT